MNSTTFDEDPIIRNINKRDKTRQARRAKIGLNIKFLAKRAFIIFLVVGLGYACYHAGLQAEREKHDKAIVEMIQLQDAVVSGLDENISQLERMLREERMRKNALPLPTLPGLDCPKN